MTRRNLLGHETSPYLLQHAGNPVHWMPWGDAALARARETDRPILLSIGYSACHWCHVMAHESFEDGATAELMNALYVSVKVDREERPDLDRIYQSAHHLLLRRPGGWPLTMFLTPDGQTPFFGGTYFPAEPHHGLPSFRDVLTQVSAYFQANRDAIGAERDAIVEALRSVDTPDPSQIPLDPAPLDPAPLEAARRQLGALFDRRHGGFGGAPKFPHPSNLQRLLRHHATHAATAPDPEALEMVLTTFRAMSSGGLTDHLGGGFFRYSTDERWMIPHFEKMLYDNGPLLELAAQCLKITGDPLFAYVARETAGWVGREMQGVDGGYGSALDADSEGEEGRFYTWDRDEARALLDEREFALLSARFGLDRPANFEGRLWHLHGWRTPQAAAVEADIDPREAADIIDRARAKLLAARERRVRPALDDKVLASWNALMIKGMSVAAVALDEPRLAACAERALDFIRHNLVVDGRLRATWRVGRARFNAYLDDHALLLDAVLSLLECRWRDEDLAFALFLADALLEHFHDGDGGGFFFTSADHEPLIVRPKPMADDALPSGNGVAARALARVGHLLGDRRYLDAARSVLHAGWESIVRVPHAHNALLDALEEQLEPPVTVVLRGAGDALERWRRRAVRPYAPARAVLPVPAGATFLPGLLAQRTPVDGAVVAYLCRGTACDAPITDFDVFDAALRDSELSRPG